ncbi:unnamed protein product [Withania somnifera]
MPESNLNGAYYGPSIPPPSKSYHRHGRGSSCNPCSCLFGCLCNCIFQIIFTILIILGIIALVLWLVLRPNKDYSTTNNTLHYDLALNMTIGEPQQTLEPFYQGHKNTSKLHPVFKGQNLVLLGDREKSNYNNEKNSGVHEIEVKLYMRIRLKIGWIKTHKIKPKIECDFKVPLESNGRSTNFEETRCHLDW